MLMARMAKIGAHPARAALDMLLLRSLKQAVYAVDNLGHFGLGSEAYLHFTSPIRRYPDLIVHRRMRAELLAATPKKPRKNDGDGHQDALTEDLEDIAMTSSQLERRSAELERQIQALYAAWLMKDRVGESHEAIITGMSESGIFVRLTELHVEGMIRLSDWQGEHFVFDEEALQLRGERTGRVLKLGEVLTVDVVGVDLARRQVAFAPTGQAPMQRRDAFPQRAFEAPRPMDRPERSFDRDGPQRQERNSPERKGHRKGPPAPRKRGQTAAEPSTLGGEDTNPRMRRSDERPHADERRKQDPYRGKKPAPQRSPEPASPSPRPVIRGPDDLRNLFGNGGGKPPAKRPR
jgi:ribonuclease R